MKCSCGGNIERGSFNCEWNMCELWDCMCDRCGHKVLLFPAKCKYCGHTLEFNYISDFIDSGAEESLTIVMTCSRCLKDFLTVGSDEDIKEYEDCYKNYIENMEE